jgi:hypothetical protein
LEYALPDPDAEGLEVQVAATLKGAVQGRELEGRIKRGVLVENEREDWQGGVDRGITQHEEAVIDGDGDEVEQNDEDSLDDRDDHATVDNKL